MNLCGFEVGLDRPFFLIAGRTRRAEQGPVGFMRGCDPGVGRKARGTGASTVMNLCGFEVGLDKPLF